MSALQNDSWPWAAGLFEGEGHISLLPYPEDDPHHRSGLMRRRLVLAMTDEDVVRRFHAFVNAGQVRWTKPFNERCKPVLRWECGAWPDIERILTGMLPYLGLRRSARAREVLANPASPVGSQKKTHCKRGHEFTPENTYTYRDIRACRTCRASASKRAKAN